MNNTSITKLALLLLSTLVAAGCDDFLGAKPEKSLVVPSKTEDLQALLDNMNVFNSTPALEVVASDEYYNNLGGWQSYGSNMVQQAHLRNFNQMFEGVVTAVEWARPYQQVYYANTCLEKAELITPSNESEASALRNVVGSAMFCRAFAFYNLIKAFGIQYDVNSAANDRGIPLPLVADVTDIQPFSSLDEVYSQILRDIEESIERLPALPKYKSRPSQAASHSLAARVYLSMGAYEEAVEHASSALQIQGKLLDFNTLNGSMAFPVPMGNEEVVYHSEIMTYSSFSRNQETRMDTLLYKMYQENDLRKSLYFVERANGAINFRGSFNGNVSLFSGLTVGEMLLVRAEASARLGDVETAVTDLNSLLQSRMSAGTFVPLEVDTAQGILDAVLTERRKEMVFRGMRWSDLKRFYQSGELAQPLIRVLGNESHVFDPEPMNFVFPIPTEEIENR